MRICNLILAAFSIAASQLNGHGFDKFTLVKAPGEYKSIGFIHDDFFKDDQYVLSYDFDLEKCTTARVKRVVWGKANCYFRIKFDYHSAIMCTPDQEFYVPANEDWVPAYKLQIGDELLSNGQDLKPITYIEFIKEPITIYILEVEEPHNYLVGHHGILTHNAAIPCELFATVVIEFIEGALFSATPTAAFGPVTMTAGAVFGGLVALAVSSSAGGGRDPRPLPEFNKQKIDDYRATHEITASTKEHSFTTFHKSEKDNGNSVADDETKEKPKIAVPEPDNNGEKKPNETPQKPGTQKKPQSEEEIKRGIKSKEKQIKKHEQKLKDYTANPDAHDNKDHLKGKTPDEREKIIKRRQEILKDSIKGFEKEIAKDKAKLPN